LALLGGDLAVAAGPHGAERWGLDLSLMREKSFTICPFSFSFT
jgi:hypothetical protein